MSNITVTDKEVRMTIEYVETFNTEAEMIEAIKGATELRGLVAKPESSGQIEGGLD